MNKVKQRKNIEKRILKNAVRLFKKRGFYHVSIDDIVKTSQISIATFYSYFPAKDDVVCIYRNDSLRKCAAFYSKLLESEEYADLDSLRRLREFLLHVMMLMNKVGKEFGSVFVQRRLRERDSVEDDKPYLPMIAEFIEAGQLDGSIRSDYSVEQLVQITDRMLTGATVRWLLHRSDQAMDSLGVEILNVYCRSIEPEKERNSIPAQPLHDAWETALYMLIPDPRSGIKQVEDNWLERFYKSD